MDAWWREHLRSDGPWFSVRDWPGGSGLMMNTAGMVALTTGEFTSDQLWEMFPDG